MIRSCSIVSLHQLLKFRPRQDGAATDWLSDNFDGSLASMGTGPQTISPMAIRESVPGHLARWIDVYCTGRPPRTTATLDAGNENRRSVALGGATTAIWILFLLLLGTVDATIPMTPRTSALQHVTNFWLQHRVPFGPPPRGSCHDYMPQFSWTEHLDWALARETHMSPKTLDPTLSWCIKHRHLFHPLEDFQNAVISDIQDLVFEIEEPTMAWFNTLPEHVQRAYRHKDSVTQIPVLIHLLRSIQYPQTELIYRELSEGFPLMGKLTPGINWHVRQDQKYLEPTPIDEFREKNRTYFTDKLEKNSVDEHWEMMLDEILAEVETGRMNGPYQAPD